MLHGTLAYLINKNGDSISCIYRSKKGIRLHPFKTGLYNIEYILNSYAKEIDTEGNLEELIKYVLKFIKRRMIVFIITDISGMKSITEDTLKKLSFIHDVMCINISDALMTGENSFDVDIEKYIPNYILEDEKLKKLEIDLKAKIYEDIKSKFKKYKISTTTINNKDSIINDIFKLLERRKNENIC